jgi:hypothetical protein
VKYYYRMDVVVYRVERQELRHEDGELEEQLDYEPMVEEVIGRGELLSAKEVAENLELISAALLSFALKIPNSERRLLDLCKNFLDTFKSARRLV